jgi:hypothetical protein
MLTLIQLTSRRPAEEPPRLDGPADLWPVLALVWVASVARVVLGFAAHEVVGAEGTLALACLVLLPWFLWNEARSGRSR